MDAISEDPYHLDLGFAVIVTSASWLEIKADNQSRLTIVAGVAFAAFALRVTA